MPQTTPFHDRLIALNQTGIWKHWSGYLVAPRYQYSETDEYYAIRNAVALLDTSPLFKYVIKGEDAQPFLEKVLARDINECLINEAQYTCWCNEEGFVLQDGVILHVDKNEYWLTAAEPTLKYFRKQAEAGAFSNLEIEDISEAYGILALQGPHALDVLQALDVEVANMPYFGVTRTDLKGMPVVLSRTGFTGDLGYEIWTAAGDALSLWDSVMAAGQNYNITPMGTTALKMARVEAGLLLLDVDFSSARFAWVDAQRETPCELGWSWMFRRLAKDERNFIGRNAIETQLKNKTQRWTTVGLEIDWHDYERVHLEAGIMPPKHGVYCESTMSIYRRGDVEWDYVGYATSFLYSSLLRRPIAIAKLPLDLAKSGTQVDLEIPVIKKPKNVLARVARVPFFNPARKTARFVND